MLIKDSAGQTLIVANDWTALPAALTAQRDQCVTLHYDTHELALEEHQHSLRWRLLFPPLVQAIEALGVARARSVSCVSPAIADVMARHYNLSRKPSVLMSVPDTPPLAPRPPSEQITVLYHGLFTANRGIANLITSAGSWPAHMRLVLRGRATSPRLDRQLTEQATPGIRTGRIVIEPMVAQSDVVAAAHSADLGVFLPDLELRQNSLALPNKLFEYLFAGLAPIVPARTEMAALLAHRMAGIRLDDPSPTGLARALSHLTVDQIMAEKLAAYQAAQTIYKEARTRTLATILADSRHTAT